MNTMPFIAAEVALGWLAEWFLDDGSTFFGNDLLGFAIIAIMALLVPLLIMAIQDDLEIIRGRRD